MNAEYERLASRLRNEVARFVKALKKRGLTREEVSEHAVFEVRDELAKHASHFYLAQDLFAAAYNTDENVLRKIEDIESHLNVRDICERYIESGGRNYAPDVPIEDLQGYD